MLTKVLMLLCSVIFGTQGARIPSYIELCKRHDPDLNQCYVKACNVILEHIGDGIPEMGLRQFDPVVIEKISFDQVGSALALDANMTNTKIYGVSKGKVLSADIDLDKPFWNISMEIPHIYLESDVVTKGKVLSFQIESNGHFRGNMSGIKSYSVWTADKEVKNGQTWFRNFRSDDLKLDIKDMSMHFDNLFQNEEINEEINLTINENIDVVYKDLSAMITSTIQSILADASNSVYGAFSVETLYAE